MKKFTCALLVLALCVTFCACEKTPTGTEKPNETATPENRYDYEQILEVNSFVETALSTYGIDYSVYSSDSSEQRIDIHVTLDRAIDGANEAFADTIERCLPIVGEASEQFDFDLGTLSISFLLYSATQKDEPDGVYRYTSDDLETGSLMCIWNDDSFGESMVADELTTSELQVALCGIGALDDDLFGDALDAFQGEWKHDRLSTRLVISGQEVNFIHYGILDNKDEVSSVNTFFFMFDDVGNLVVANQHSQPRYTLTLNESGQIAIENIGEEGEDADLYNWVSNTAEVPLVKEEPAIGMTESEVYASSWGYPKKKNTTTTTYGVHEQWVYDDGYIYLEDGIVTAIQER